MYILIINFESSRFAVFCLGAAVTLYNPVTDQPSSSFTIMEKNISTMVELCFQLLSGPYPIERAVPFRLTTENDTMGMYLQLACLLELITLFCRIWEWF